MENKSLQSINGTNFQKRNRFDKLGLKIFVILTICFIVWKFHTMLLGVLIIPLLFFGCLFGGGC